jgi:hypothetical protein
LITVLTATMQWHRRDAKRAAPTHVAVRTTSAILIWQHAFPAASRIQARRRWIASVDNEPVERGLISSIEFS